jgi:hypothetical protein
VDEDSRMTIEYLRARPRGAVIRWASDHVTAEQPWSTHWIDVRIPEGSPPDMSWVWTILDPGDAHRSPPEQLWQFPWPHDLDVHSVFDPVEGGYVNELVVAAGEVLPLDVVVSYEHLAQRVELRYRQHFDAMVEAKPVPLAIYEDLIRDTGSAYHVRGGWSVGAVCGALSDWADRHAGRRDLRFEWNPDAGDSPALQRVKERLARRARRGI